MRRVLHALLIIVTIGCAPVRPVSPIVKKIDQPPLNQQSIVELGDSIIDKGYLITIDALQLDTTVSAGDGILTPKFTIHPGILVARDETDDERYYYATSVTVTNGFDGFGDYIHGGGIKISRDGNSWAIFRDANAQALSIPKNSARRIKATLRDRPSFRQQLLYDGRAGSTVKFSYREFGNDRARSAFTQEVQYDLNESSVIGFKGARVRIIKATNTQLIYIVLSSFPDQP